MNWRVLNEAETDVVEAVLREIEDFLERCYWNSYQMDMQSPFQNTGGNNKYKCSAFKVHGYEWDDDKENKNNFVYKYKEHPERRMKVDWYKYLGRGMCVRVPEEWKIDYLPEMMQRCKDAMREDFGEHLL